MDRKIFGLTLLLSVSVAAQGFAAQSLSQPGEEIAGQAPAPAAGVESPETPEQQAVAIKFTIKKVNIDAVELKIKKEPLAKLLAPVVGREITLGELNTALSRVTAYCRTHGYPASAAYLPAQDSKDGEVTIRIIPGRYGDIKIDNHSKLKNRVAARFIKGLKKGEIIRSGSLESTLYSISDVSGTRAVGVLAPGKDFGTSDVTVRIEDGKRTNTVLYAENYGTKSAGRYRYGVQHSIYDVGDIGARASIGGLISNSHMHNYYANYEAPVGRGGATLGLGFSQMDYKLGGVMRELGANGKADTLSLFGSYPFFHTHTGQLKLTYGYDYRWLKDDLDSYDGLMDRKKHSSAAHVGVTGANAYPGTSVSYDATVTAGRLGLDSTGEVAKILDEASDTEGSFTKLTVDGTVVRMLGHKTDLMVKTSAQTASRNLDGSEQMYLGGANGVRAYPQGEASGDTGVLGTAELRYYTDVPGLVLSTYFDAGYVNNTKDRNSPTSEGGTNLKGWGLAASYTRPGDWFARFDWARRIGTPDGISKDAESRNRLWFLLGKIW